MRTEGVGSSMEVSEALYFYENDGGQSGLVGTVTFQDPVISVVVAVDVFDIIILAWFHG